VETDGVAAAANLLANFRNGIQAKTRETETAGAAGGLGSKAWKVEMHSGEWLESGDRSLSLFLGDDGRLRVLKVQ
jgi:glycerate kinase